MQAHKKWVRATFDQAAPLYGERGCTYFDDFGKKLVDLAGVKSGMSVLDVATGKGAVLSPVSQIAARAVGVDISPRMLQELKKKLPESELLEMDAEHLSFPNGSFDRVFCAFGLFFFPNPAAALGEFKRVLKPGGKIALSVWGKRTPLEDWIYKRVQELGAKRLLRTIIVDSEERLRSHLQGFSKVEIKEESKICTSESAKEWWESLWSHGTRAFFEQLSPENLNLLKQEALLQAGTGKIVQERKAIFAVLEN